MALIPIQPNPREGGPQEFFRWFNLVYQSLVILANNVVLLLARIPAVRTASIYRKSSTTTYFPLTTPANMDTTYFKWVLPVAGTYHLMASFAVTHIATVACGAFSELYNNTAGAKINETEFLVVSSSDNNDSFTIGVSYHTIVTVTAASTIYYRGYTSSANQIHISTAPEYFSDFTWVKLD